MYVKTQQMIFYFVGVEKKWHLSIYQRNYIFYYGFGVVVGSGNLRRLAQRRPLQQLTRLLHGGKTQAVGGNVHATYSVGGFVGFQANLHLAPRERAVALGAEIAPFGEQEIIGSKTAAVCHHLLGAYGLERHFFGFAAIHFAKSINQRSYDIFGCDVGELGKIHHTALDRRYAVFLQLGWFHLEETLYVGGVGLYQNGAMVKVVVAAFGEGVA